MADLVGLDWSRYFRGLPTADARALAGWLSSRGLRLGEFMEIVDRAYATSGYRWRGRSDAFVSLVGTPMAERYAHRKHRVSMLVALREEALASGAFPREVAASDLDFGWHLQIESQSESELLARFERLSQRSE